MNIPKDCVIIGGGSSINKGISLGLKDFLKDKFVILTNYTYKFFDGSMLCFTDRDFYKPRIHLGVEPSNPDIYEELKSFTFIVGINQNGIEEFKLPNTLLVKKSNTYNGKDSLTKGFYTGYEGDLTGIFAISLASYIMKEEGNIYLLGFDWNRRQKKEENKVNYSPTDKSYETHFYDNIEHRGKGYLGFYENHNPNKSFEPFLKSKDLKIYNVSLKSNITLFTKLSYSDFLKTSLESFFLTNTLPKIFKSN